MKWSNVVICMAFYLIGVWVGMFDAEIVEIQMPVVVDKIVEVEVEKIVKVWDFAQEPEIMEHYANTMGLTLKSEGAAMEAKIKAIRKQDQSYWTAGYKRGYEQGHIDGSR